jgi:5-hydroxyisourate hydrolase
MSTKGPITTHVLDVSRGKPAAGIAVQLEILGANRLWTKLGEGTTDADGRILDLLAREGFAAGHYRLTFATAAYFQTQNIESFYPQVQIEFTAAATSEHYHVPLLLSPFGFSTYRGS